MLLIIITTPCVIEGNVIIPGYSIYLHCPNIERFCQYSIPSCLDRCSVGYGHCGTNAICYYLKGA